MKKYIVKDRGLEWNYESKDNAEKKATELGTEVVEKTVWRYYAPYYTSGTANYREISGKSLIDAIVNNFGRIMKDYNFGGVAGYKLKSVKLIRNQYAQLHISYILLGKLGTEDLRNVQVNIEGVTNEDFPDLENVLY